MLLSGRVQGTYVNVFTAVDMKGSWLQVLLCCSVCVCIPQLFCDAPCVIQRCCCTPQENMSSGVSSSADFGYILYFVSWFGVHNELSGSTYLPATISCYNGFESSGRLLSASVSVSELRRAMTLSGASFCECLSSHRRLACRGLSACRRGALYCLFSGLVRELLITCDFLHAGFLRSQTGPQFTLNIRSIFAQHSLNIRSIFA